MGDISVSAGRDAIVAGGDQSIRREADADETTTRVSSGSIFLSYRRTDRDYARELYHRLTTEFGEGSVFRDSDSLVMGENWQDGITKALDQCRSVLILIGPGWTPSEWVSREALAGLERTIPVTPVLVGGATLPKRLEGDMVKLLDRQAVVIHSDEFESGLARLIEGLRGHV